MTQSSSFMHVSTPRGYPVIGVLPSLLRDPWHYTSNVFRRYGDLVCLDLGFAKAYVIGHADHAQYVLRDNKNNFDKGDNYDPVRRLLGKGLASSEGELWLQQRRMLQPLFLKQQLAGLAPLITRTIDDSLARWPVRSGGARFELFEGITHMVTRIILRAMFNAALSEAECDEASKAVKTAADQIGTRLWTFFLPRSLPLPGERELRKAVHTIDSTIFRILSERRRRRSGAVAEGQGDLIDLLLDTQDEESGQRMSDLQVRDEAVTFFAAGIETTANMLAWTFYLLCAHPEIERKVRDEVEAVVGDRTPTFEDLNKLTYSKMVLQEALRLYPPGWMIPRHAIAEDVIHGHRIPKDAVVIVLVHAIHRHPALWPDPEVFRPERFTPEETAKRHRSAYLPFGFGARQCIGNHLALMEGQLVLSMVAQRFRMRLVPGHKVVPRVGMTLYPKDGVLVTLEPARARGAA